MLEGLRFARASEGIPSDLLDEFENLDGPTRLGLRPERQLLNELFVEEQPAVSQGPLPPSVRQSSSRSPRRGRAVRLRRRTGVRSQVSEVDRQSPGGLTALRPI